MFIPSYIHKCCSNTSTPDQRRQDSLFLVAPRKHKKEVHDLLPWDTTPAINKDSKWCIKTNHWKYFILHSCSRSDSFNGTKHAQTMVIQQTMDNLEQLLDYLVLHHHLLSCFRHDFEHTLWYFLNIWKTCSKSGFQKLLHHMVPNHWQPNHAQWSHFHVIHFSQTDCNLSSWSQTSLFKTETARPHI